jgi:hypothetical protein
MNPKRLSIAQLQIFLDENGTACFSDALKRDRAAVQTALSGYRDFIDLWLEASDGQRARSIPLEERELRAKLKQSVRDLRRRPQFDAELIKSFIEIAAKVAGERSATLSPIQIAESIDDAISAL